MSTDLPSAEERRAAAITERAAGAPEKYRGTYLAATAGTCSPRKAIKAMCQHCMGWEGHKRSLAAEIENCASLACPLWSFRPRHHPEGSVSDDFDAPETVSECPDPS